MKHATACAVTGTRLDQFAQAAAYRDLPLVVFYHRVVEQLNGGDGFPVPAMEITVAMLERHLDWLGKRFRIVSLEDLTAEMEKVRRSRPLAVVTFDDGYNEIYHHAFPLLKRKGIPAGIFVITGLVGSNRVPIHEQLHALLVGASRQGTSRREWLTELLQETNVKLPSRESAPKYAMDPFSAETFLLQSLAQSDVQRVIDYLENTTNLGDAWDLALRPLSWEMLAEMRDAGMTIGSHSKTHAVLSNESRERVREEVEDSRHELERRLGVEISCFAYPGGSFDSSVVSAVSAAGYRYAFTICRDRDPQHPMLTIPRIGLWQQSCLDSFGRFSPSIMSCQAAGTFKWFSKCSQDHAASRMFSQPVEPAYLNVPTDD